jgi:hydroxypyruvate isomerase
MKFTLSVNIELMFPGKMPAHERVEAVGKMGAKAYSFWNFAGKDLDKIQAIQEKYHLQCGSITGNNKTGWGNGLTKPGFEAEFLADFSESVAVAKRLGCKNLITFVGKEQKDIPWSEQEAQCIAGLKKAGDIAAEAGVFLTLEPLNIVESPQMSMIYSKVAYALCAGANHPNIKVDFDIYHRALGEGNVIATLKEGIQKGYVTFVEVGDVPGRFEPGTGETNYTNVFKVLKELNYTGYIGMEHRASKTPQEAYKAVLKIAEKA